METYKNIEEGLAFSGKTRFNEKMTFTTQGSNVADFLLRPDHAIKRLEKKISEANDIKQDESKYREWLHHTGNDLTETFGEQHPFTKKFFSLQVRHTEVIKLPPDFHGNPDYIRRGEERPISIALPEQINHLKKCIENLQWKIEEQADVSGIPVNNEELIVTTLTRFHCSASFLSHREKKRASKKEKNYLIEDEYDVQDLLYAFLLPHVKDLAWEDPTPKVSGKSGRIDLVSKSYGVAIEVKYLREANEVEKAIRECHERVMVYSEWPWLKTLIFFIYDPLEYLPNADSFIQDLTRSHLNNGRQVFNIKGIVSPCTG